MALEFSLLSTKKLFFHVILYTTIDHNEIKLIYMLESCKQHTTTGIIAQPDINGHMPFQSPATRCTLRKGTAHGLKLASHIPHTIQNKNPQHPDKDGISKITRFVALHSKIIPPPPPHPCCVPSNNVSQSATVSKCLLCCTRFGYYE